MNQKPNLERTYCTLPSTFYHLQPARKHRDTLTQLNTDLADSLGLSIEFLKSEQGVQFLGGEDGGFNQAYCGHQYGYFTMLGDGRAMVLGELVTEEGRFDLQLKGSGITPYSRRGDGLATLESMLREYLVSEAMYHLGVPTTRSLAVLRTNETVTREIPHKGAILVRCAKSHIRIGTIEYARAIEDSNAPQELVDYTIERHYPLLTNHPQKYLQFLQEISKKQAKLIAMWQSLGFVHGVQNTDNVAISGETIDYGPCAFLDTYDPTITFSSIDKNGRYSYQNQPYIGSWNLSKLGTALLPLIDGDPKKAVDQVNPVLQDFEQQFYTEYRIQMALKLGILNPQKEDDNLIHELLDLMKQSNADYTNTFYYLTRKDFQKLPFGLVERTMFLDKWLNRIQQESTVDEAIAIMKQHNPIIIPRNQLVYDAIQDAAFRDDYTLFNLLYEELRDPYNYDKEIDERLQKGSPPKTVFRTYCGT